MWCKRFDMIESNGGRALKGNDQRQVKVSV